MASDAGASQASSMDVSSLDSSVEIPYQRAPTLIFRCSQPSFPGVSYCCTTGQDLGHIPLFSLLSLEASISVPSPKFTELCWAQHIACSFFSVLGCPHEAMRVPLLQVRQESYWPQITHQNAGDVEGTLSFSPSCLVKKPQLICLLSIS